MFLSEEPEQAQSDIKLSFPYIYKKNYIHNKQCILFDRLGWCHPHTHSDIIYKKKIYIYKNNVCFFLFSAHDISSKSITIKIFCWFVCFSLIDLLTIVLVFQNSKKKRENGNVKREDENSSQMINKEKYHLTGNVIRFVMHYFL